MLWRKDFWGKGRKEMAEYQTFEAHPISGSHGAVLSGIDLSQKLSNAEVEDIHQAFLDYNVIVFRDQKLDPEQHKSVGRLFGDIIPTPFVKSRDGHPEIIEIIKEAEDVGKYNFGGSWHTDVSYLEEPALGSALYALEVPPYGGDTMFTNMYAAYETLSDGMKDLIGDMKAVHSAARSYGTQGKFAAKENHTKAMSITNSEAGDTEFAHPVVRTHPDTGRKCLFVNPNYTIRLEGMTESESEPLLSYLYQHSIRQEFVARITWGPGTLTIWDNRCTMHSAVNDYDGHKRQMNRVTIAGNRPY